MGIYLSCLGAESNNTIIIFVFNLQSLLVRLQILELPCGQLLVALTEQMRINVLTISEDYLKLAGCTVACVVLIVNVI